MNSLRTNCTYIQRDMSSIAWACYADALYEQFAPAESNVHVNYCWCTVGLFDFWRRSRTDTHGLNECSCCCNYAELLQPIRNASEFHSFQQHVVTLGSFFASLLLCVRLKHNFLRRDSLLLRKARYCDRMSSVRPSVCLSVTLMDHDHIGWKSWKLIESSISPTPSIFVAQKPSIYSQSQGHMEKFWRGKGVVVKSGVHEHESGNRHISATRKDRGKVTMEGL